MKIFSKKSSKKTKTFSKIFQKTFFLLSFGCGGHILAPNSNVLKNFLEKEDFEYYYFTGGQTKCVYDHKSKRYVYKKDTSLYSKKELIFFSKRNNDVDSFLDLKFREIMVKVKHKLFNKVNVFYLLFIKSLSVVYENNDFFFNKEEFFSFLKKISTLSKKDFFYMMKKGENNKDQEKKSCFQYIQGIRQHIMEFLPFDEYDFLMRKSNLFNFNNTDIAEIQNFFNAQWDHFLSCFLRVFFTLEDNEQDQLLKQISSMPIFAVLKIIKETFPLIFQKCKEFHESYDYDNYYYYDTKKSFRNGAFEEFCKNIVTYSESIDFVQNYKNNDLINKTLAYHDRENTIKKVHPNCAIYLPAKERLYFSHLVSGDNTPDSEQNDKLNNFSFNLEKGIGKNMMTLQRGFFRVLNPLVIFMTWARKHCNGSYLANGNRLKIPKVLDIYVQHYQKVYQQKVEAELLWIKFFKARNKKKNYLDVFFGKNSINKKITPEGLVERIKNLDDRELTLPASGDMAEKCLDTNKFWTKFFTTYKSNEGLKEKVQDLFYKKDEEKLALPSSDDVTGEFVKPNQLSQKKKDTQEYDVEFLYFFFEKKGISFEILSFLYHKPQTSLFGKILTDVVDPFLEPQQRFEDFLYHPFGVHLNVYFLDLCKNYMDCRQYIFQQKAMQDPQEALWNNFIKKIEAITEINRNRISTKKCELADIEQSAGTGKIISLSRTLLKTKWY